MKNKLILFAFLFVIALPLVQLGGQNQSPYTTIAQAQCFSHGTPVNCVRTTPQTGSNHKQRGQGNQNKQTPPIGVDFGSGVLAVAVGLMISLRLLR